MARNPFSSEADAYRFLLLTIGYFALIVAAAALNTWLGLAVFLVLSGVVLWRFLAARSEPHLRPPVSQRAHAERCRAVRSSRERIVDLQYGVVAALGLPMSQGLYPVTVQPATGSSAPPATTAWPTLPDTALPAPSR